MPRPSLTGSYAHLGSNVALWRFSRMFVLLAVLFTTLGTTMPGARAAAAAAPAASAETLSVDGLQRLVVTIEDEGKRKELVATLQGLIAAQQTQDATANSQSTISGRLIAFLDAGYATTRQSLDALANAVGSWPDWITQTRQVFADPVKRQQGVHSVLAFVAVFAVGWFAELLTWWLMTTPRQRLEAVTSEVRWERLWRGALRVLLDLVPIGIFAAAAYVAALTMEPPRAVQSTALNFVNAYVLARAILAFARMLLSPRAAVLRPLPLGDATALDLFRWVRRYVGLGVGGFFLIAAAVLLGLPNRLTPMLYDMLYLALALLSGLFILYHRSQFSRWIESQASQCQRFFAVAPLLRLVAALWHVLAIAYLIVLFFIAAFDVEDGLSYVLHGTLVTAAAVAVAAMAISLLHPKEAAVTPVKAAPATATLSRRLYGYTPFIRLGIAGLVVVAALAFVLDAWGVPAIAWLLTPRGQQVIGGALSIALTVGIAVVAWELANAAIERYLTQHSSSGADVRLPGARARTLLPLARKMLLVLLTVMVVLITLSELGIDIAPLLAGAGVVGLAIGFGAQKMVQDVITGFFILVEDAIAVGDVVTVSGASGVVEDLSVRAIKLRDQAGAVHTVPFSSVDTVTNMTKTFSYYVIDVGVAYKEDTDQVAQVCREIVEEMRREPPYAVNILEPLDVLGLDSFADSAVIVKMRIKTRPIKQWEVGREFNRRLKKRFEALGIEFPFPHRTLLFGSEPERLDPPSPAATAA